MKHSALVKVLCLLISVTLAFSVSVTAFAESSTVEPVIFVMGIYENALYSDPDTTDQVRLFPPTQSDALQIATKFIVSLIVGSQGGNFDEAATYAMQTCEDMLTPILCQPTGESKAKNIGPLTYNYSLDKYTDAELAGCLDEMGCAVASKVGANNCYCFTYDFREAPLDHAAELNSFIKSVKSKTGASKVRIVAAGYGGIVTDCYLYKYENEAAKDVSAINFFTSLIAGSSLVGDIMKGNLAYTLEDYNSSEMDSFLDIYGSLTGNARGSAFIRYMNDLPTTLKSSLANYLAIYSKNSPSSYTTIAATFAMWLTNNILNQENIWTNTGLDYNLYISHTQTSMYNDYLKDLLKYDPGFWAMVPDDDYKEARNFMFDDEVIDATLEKKLDQYYDCQTAVQDTLGTAKSNGINITLLAGYDLQSLPIAASIGEQSDDLVSTKYASLGCTDTQLNDYWLRTTAQCQDKTHDHIDRNDWIDASTCMFPENTWFVKDLPHLGVGDSTMADVVCYLISDGQKTVWDSAMYPQFMYYSSVSGKVTPYGNSSQSQNANGYKLGDVDLDGDVDADDARLALRFSVGLEKFSAQQIINADVDSDGNVTSGDARAILRTAIGLQTL